MRTSVMWRAPGSAPLVGFALLVVAPGQHAGVFDGMPLSSWPEFVVAVLSAILVLTGDIRRELLRVLGTSRRVVRIVTAVLLVLVVVKVGMGAAAPSDGRFDQCFLHADDGRGEAVTGADCIPTFAEPPGFPADDVFPGGRSRSSGTIDYRPRVEGAAGLSRTNWNLPFVNSFRYDRGYFPWEPAERDIEFFPFRASFLGRVDVDRSDDVVVEYVGEGTLMIGTDTVALPPSYDDVARVVATSDERRPVIRLDFAYLATRLNSEGRDVPYAQLTLGDSGGRALTAVNPAFSRALQATIDVTIGAMVALLLWLARRRISSVGWGAPLVAVCAAVAVERAGLPGHDLPIEPSVLVLGVLVLLVGAGRIRRIGSLVIPCLVVSGHLVWNELRAIAGHVVGADYVIVRTRGNDQLVYRAFVQEMMHSGFLRGGEDVFYFQPGIRYVLYALHWMVGSGDALVGVVIVCATMVSIVWLAHGLSVSGGRRRMAVLVGLCGLVIWCSSSLTVQTMVVGLSEFGTWPLLLVAFGLIVRAPSRRDADVVFGALLALIVWIRPNQGVAVLALLVLWVVVVRAGRKGVPARIVAPATTLLLMSLVPVHNLVFGGRFVILPGGHVNADQVGWLAPFSILGDESIRRFYSDQVKGILYLPTVLPDVYSAKLGLAFLCFLITCALGVVASVRRIRATRWLCVLVAAVLMGQLVPFVNYSVYRYFPVHVVAIQLTAVLAGFVLLVSSSGRHPAVMAGAEATSTST